MQQSNLSIYVFTYLIIPFILLYHSKIGNNPNFLSKDNTNQIKGLMILIVILHHISQRMISPGLMYPFLFFGYLAVSVFMFFSGYGLTTSQQRKDYFFKTFLSKRFNRVYVPFILINIITIILYTTLLNEQYTVSNIISYIIGTALIDPITWYVIMIILSYIYYYIVFSRFSKQTALKLLTVFSLSYCLFCMYIGLKNYWYVSIFAFPFGVYVSLNFEKVYNILQSKKTLFTSMVVFSVVFGISTSAHFICINILKSGEIFTNLIVWVCYVASSTLFVICVLVLMTKIEFRSKVFAFLGLISYEIYLVHMKIYTLYSNYSNINVSYNIGYYVLLVIIVSAAFKEIVDKCFNFNFMKRHELVSDNKLKSKTR